jgi:pimeloyl-ACP methyl ester carboxylesterase
VVHDLGGPIGLGLAARRPQLVRALVATQTFGWPPEQRVLRAMLGLMGSAPMRGLNTTTNLVPRITATSFGVGRHLGATGRRAFLGPLRDRRRRATFHRLMADARRADELLGAIELALAGTLRDRPLLTIFGERNDPLGFQARWRELFPAARQVVVPGGNHFPMNDDPDLFAAAVRSWWEDQVSRDTRPT